MGYFLVDKRVEERMGCCIYCVLEILIEKDVGESKGDGSKKGNRLVFGYV